MKKLQSALAYIIKHPKKSWNIVTKHDRSFGTWPFNDPDDFNAGAVTNTASGAVFGASFLGSVMTLLVVMVILTIGISIWILTVIYRLGSQSENACNLDLIDSWKFIGRHLVFALILSGFLPGAGHLYLIYVLISAETKFTALRSAVYRRKVDAKGAAQVSAQQSQETTHTAPHGSSVHVAIPVASVAQFEKKDSNATDGNLITDEPTAAEQAESGT